MVYEQPVRLVPARVGSRESYGTSTTATIYSLDTGEEKYRGRVEHTVERATEASVDTEEGRLEGYWIPIDHRIHPDLADVRMRLDTMFAPGEGLVYQSTTLTIDKPAWFGSTTRLTAARVAADD